MRKSLLTSLICGLLLNIPFTFPHLFTQVIALLIIAPFLAELYGNKSFKERLLLTVIFVSAWMIPQCLWYGRIMTFPVQAARTIGNVSLIVLVVSLPALLRIENKAVFFSVIILAWTAMIAGRAWAGFSESWVVPDLYHTQWRNALMVGIADVFTFIGVTFTVLVINSVLAILNRKAAVITAATVLAVCIVYSLLLYRTEFEYDYNFIAIQQPDETKLFDDTAAALRDLDTSKPTFVLWWENELAPEMQPRIQQFAKDHNLFFIFDRETPSGEALPYDTAVAISPHGEEILYNHKRQAAPGEKIVTASGDYAAIEVLDDLSITTAVCYDLMFANFIKLAPPADIVFTPVDDAKFGRTYHRLHSAMIVYRAVETDMAIISAGPTGPTMITDSNGILRRKPLPFYSIGTLQP